MVLAIGLLVGGGLMVTANTGFIGEREVITSAAPASLQQTAVLGELIYVGVGNNITVTAPNGQEVERNTAGQFQATMTGVYNVRFEENGAIFDFSVRVRAEGDFELRVAHGGAQIPSFVTYNGYIVLPEAHLYQRGLRSGDEFQRMDNEDYELVIRINGEVISEFITVPTTHSNNSIHGMRAVRARAGIQTIEYIARQLADDGETTIGRVFYERFTVRVQHNFEYSGSPSLSVGAVPVHASTNTRVVIPAATATDTFDDRVFIQIDVFGPPSGNVPEAERRVREPYNVNRHGFAEAGTLGDVIVFDNAREMFFYPTVDGQYTVRFTAINDQGGRSAVITRTIDVRDRTAPFLYQIDDHMIPRNWGREVIFANPVAGGQPLSHGAFGYDANTSIFIPFPNYVDNVDERAHVTFTIRDTENNRNILSLNNINQAPGTDGARPEARVTYTANSQTNGWYNVPAGIPNRERYMEFTENGFWFNFAFYNPTLGQASEAPFGRYVLTFQARDSQPNITTRTYDIQFHDVWTDTQIPTINQDFRTDRFVFLTSEAIAYQLPQALISDNDDRLNVVYGIVFENNAGDMIERATDETITIGRNEESTVGAVTANHQITQRFSLILENGANIEISENTIYFWERGVTRNTQNIQSIAIPRNTTDATYNATQMRVVVMVSDSVGNSAIKGNTGDDTVIEIVRAGEIVDGVDLEINANLNTTNGVHTVGYVAELGRIEFNNFPMDLRNYVGFELALRDERGRIIPFNFTTWTQQSTNSNVRYGTIIVENISFTPGVAEHFTLTARAFDITGRSVVSVFGFNVDENGANGGPITGTSASFPTTGDVHTAIRLPHETAPMTGFYGNNDYAYVVREFKDAGHFSLMGVDLTVLTAGRTMRITTGYRTVAGARPGHATGWNGLGQTIDFTATETANITFAFQNAMPTYSQVFVTTANGELRPYETRNNNARLVLPQVVAHSEHANAEIEIEIQAPRNMPRVTVQQGVFAVRPNGHPYIYRRNAYNAHVPAEDDYMGNIYGRRFIEGSSGATEYIRIQRNQALRHPGNSFSFTPTVHGSYTITYTASVGGRNETTHTVTIRVGNITPPNLIVEGNDPTQVRIGHEFSFRPVRLEGVESAALEYITITRRLIAPGGSIAYEFSTTRQRDGETGDENMFNRTNRDGNDADRFVINESGTFTIEYIAVDRHENRTYIRRTMTVTADAIDSQTPLRVLQIVLIIVGALLIAGVLLYFIRYRKVREVPKAKADGPTEKETE